MREGLSDRPTGQWAPEDGLGWGLGCYGEERSLSERRGRGRQAWRQSKERRPERKECTDSLRFCRGWEGGRARDRWEPRLSGASMC